MLGLDPSLGCRICEHITNIVNSDTDITEYRRTLDTGYDRVHQLYRTQCEWYRELTHNRTVTGDTSPSPSLHVTDIYLYYSDSDTVRLTGEMMSANLGTIVSVKLQSEDSSLHGVVELLPQCRHLTALYIGFMINTKDLLVCVIPRLTHLTTVQYNVWYDGIYDGLGDRYEGILFDAADRAAVAAVMSLTQLEWIRLGAVSLDDDGVRVTDAMTRLRTVVLYEVYMTAEAWDRFVTSLLTLPQSVSVVLSVTDIDRRTVRRIQTSQCVTVTRDDGEGKWGRYNGLEFTTIPSQM